ncbi:MAG TPA: radical SAM protein [Geothrix sp.]
MTTVILKPTDGCNARCLYCSAAHPGTAKRMTPETLEAVFRLFGDWALLRGQRDLQFIWHGGEPLLMPDSFWDRVFQGQEELLRNRGIGVENGIQTNATLIRPDTIPLLKRLLGDRGSVGTSADPLPGIRELKGAPDGRYGEKLNASLGLLRDAGIRYGILFVVHRLALPHLPEIYRNFRERHPVAGLRFNPLYRQGRASDSGTWDDLGLTADEWGQALIALHRAWDADGRPGNVQPFGPWQRLFEGGAWRLSCENSGNCAGSHFGVDPDGTVYLCGRSADGHSSSFGSADELTAAALAEHPIHRMVNNRRVYLKQTFCKGCPWWLHCHGGCVNDSLLGSGTPFAPTSFCAGLRTFFDEVYGSVAAPC